jgi:hypothetical protein
LVTYRAVTAESLLADGCDCDVDNFLTFFDAVGTDAEDEDDDEEDSLSATIFGSFGSFGALSFFVSCSVRAKRPRSVAFLKF